MRTIWGIRASVRQSKVPKADWARELGITYGNLNLMIRGDSRMQQGPAMQRLVRMVEALDAGRVKWVAKRGPTHRLYWELEGPERFTPVAGSLAVDFLHGRVDWAGGRQAQG